MPSPIIGGKRQRFSVAQLVTALEPRPEQRPSEAIGTAVSSSPWVDDYVPSPITVEEARGFRVEYYWAQEIFATNHNMIMAIEGDGGAHDMPVPRYICPPSQMAQRQLRSSNEGAVAEAGPSRATAANEMAEIDVWDPPGDYDVNYAEEATEILNSAILQDEPPSPETELAEARRHAMAAFLAEAPRPLRPVSRAPHELATKAFHPTGWRFPRANISIKKRSYDSGPGDDTRLDGPSRPTKKRATERRIGFFYADWFEYMSDEARPESDYWPSAQLLSHADSRGPRPLVGAEWMMEWRRQVNSPWLPEYGRPEYGPSYVEGDDIEIVRINDVEQDKSSEGSLGTGRDAEMRIRPSGSDVGEFTRLLIPSDLQSNRIFRVHRYYRLPWTVNMKPRISRVPVPPSLRLGSTRSATTLRPEVQYEAESSTAAQRRQQLESSSPSASSGAARPTWSSGGYGASNEKRRCGPKAISLLRAQKFAKALAAATPPSKIDIPLRSTPPSPPTIPTLADLESKRPDREPPHITARSYKKQYQRLYNNIDQAFVAKQIIKLASQLGVNTRKGKTRTKDTAIRGVLETWGWEDPQLAEAIYAAREVQERDWKMSRAELWLMMRDEEFVRPTLDDGIKLSVPVPVAETEGGQIEDTRDLRGRGDPYALAEMDQRIMDRRVIIQQNSRTFQSESGSDIHNDAGLLGTISNATGVYLEPAVQGAIRLVALDSLQLDKAITLLHQAKTHASVRATTPLSLVSSSSNLEMSLFPHIPTSFSAIPWQEIGTLRKPLFRVRGVQPWETKVGMRDVAHREERLGQSLHIGVTGGRREAATLEAAMGQGMGGIQCSTRTARFGHLLFPDASPHASVLVPSKRSSWTADNIGTSPTAQISPVFFPSVPPAIIQFPISGTARTIRRLRYQAVEKSTRFLEISLELPPKPQAETATSMLDTTLEAGSKWHKELDAQMASLGVDEIEVEPEAAGDAGEVSPIQPETPLKIEARVFEEKVENMMMPDRPIDFTMTTSLLPHQIDISDHLAFLQPYLQHLEGSAPTTLELDEQWMLYTAEELDILERDLSAGETELTSPPAGLLLRTVKATDLTLGQGRAVRYAELETEATGDMPSAFWQQLAFWTRAVAPGAGQIRNTFY